MANPIVKTATGVAKGIMFVIHVLTNTQGVASQIGKLSGPVLAAMMAVFYDVMKSLTAGGSAAAAAEAGDILGAITFSETTVGLVQKVVADFKAAEQLVVADMKTLGVVSA